MSDDWPLVGRSRELRLIRREWDEVRSAGVILAGPSGVGKTRLAKEAVDIAARSATSPAPTHWIHASQSAATIPFGAVAHLLAPPSPSLGGPAQLLHQTSRQLASRADGHRVVLGVDDAHLLDDASATLVHQLAATGTAFVVLTAPIGSRMPDPIFALWKDRLVDWVDVAPLERADADALLAEALHGQVEGATALNLWRLTLGRPLFLRELVEGGLTGGDLVEQRGMWRWRGPLVPTPRLVELVETRIGVLEPGERLLVELLAFGEPVGVEVLARAGAVHVLASTERRGLLLSEQAGRRVDVRLAHPLYTEVVRLQTPARRAREVHRMLADLVGATPSRRAADRARVVSWRLAAGMATEAQALVTAAAHALAWSDYPLAERLARAAVDAGRGVTGDIGNDGSGDLAGGFDATHHLARALIGLGRCEEADALLADGLDAQDLGEAHRVQSAITRSTNLYWGLGRLAQAEDTLRAAAAVISHPARRDELDTVRAGLLLHSGDCQEGLAAVTGVLHRREADDGVLLQALTTATQVMSVGGRSRQAIEAAERGLDLERRAPDVASPWSHVLLEAGRCGGFALAGYLDEATALARDGYHNALARRWPLGTAQFAMWLGHINRIRGRPRTALSWLREAAAGAEPDTAKPFFLPAVLGNTAMAAALVGDLGTADAAQAAAVDALSATSRLFEVVPALSGAWLAAARGETSRAVDLAMAAAELAGSRGQLQFRVVALHDAVRFDAARLVADQLAETAANTEGLLAPAYRAHGTALATGDAAGLDAVANRFAELGALLFAAEAAAHAARAHREDGSPGRAAAADNRARAWAQQCEGAGTPALDLPTQPRHLTGRETEIARLAAGGLTSRVIANRLVVSVRTVDNVLHGVYAKLGITGRHELADVMGLVAARPE